MQIFEIPLWASQVATALFSAAVIHTFFGSRIQHFSGKFHPKSFLRKVFHLLGEVEIVFGFWAFAFLIFLTFSLGSSNAFNFVQRLHFTEPLFVLVIMTITATRPILSLAHSLIFAFAKIFPAKDHIKRAISIYFTCLTIGPLFGSLITEPAAMTLVALILKEQFFKSAHKDTHKEPVGRSSLSKSYLSKYYLNEKIKYTTLAVLFVNISIGGVLTSFAAPPVLMVAGAWNWNSLFMLKTFGWKALLATFTNGILAVFYLRKDLLKLSQQSLHLSSTIKSPAGITFVHLLFLLFIIINATRPFYLLGAFFLFLAWTKLTQKHQDKLKLRESALVAFFLGGLVILGKLQNWWIEPFLKSLSSLQLFLGTTLLTAITDNAALTYLGTQIQDISPSFQYALVSGAIAGGGLTVIANAPNPIGYSILQEYFGPDGIKPLKLLLFSLTPTAVAMLYLWGSKI